MSDPTFDLGENPAENLQRLTVFAFGKLFATMQIAELLYRGQGRGADDLIPQIADDLLEGARICNSLLDELESQQSESEPVTDES